ncbi:BTAD domain-containing putative transcriptional regulator [Actinophytocola sp.]|uniref:BTAD domain-containing putative transcriptional regulator n=1 Tax=Actinophytocola sp. TaxID=1872138 RepID=UPI002D232DB9|nr:BTAD domain-containing putative transcriptional regulator [Actinophytocola sp.]HYQ63447.1 BTAD domain-containing putative transcriptional regulator [Actinophytocola sp.]
MRVGLLGALEVRDDAGRPVEVPGTRLRTLLARLVLGAGRPVSGAELIDAVWGAHPPRGAANALQTLVSRLRRTLPGLQLAHSAAGYRLAGVDADVTTFERLAAEGRASRDAGDPAAARDRFTEALRLGRGDPRADLPDATRLTELRLRTVEDLADLTSGGEDIAELAGLVAAHPLRERLAATYMRALVAAGRPAQALTVYADLRRALATELGTDPSPEIRDLHTAILRGGNERRAGPRAPVTSFVGREDDMDRLHALLADARLVTLVGPGGAGKTRLAAELAGRHTDVLWAELADVADADRLPAVVSGALGPRHAGLPGTRAGDPVAMLTTDLGDRQALLVLDNCEHLVDACARLADRILAACPGVRIVATSREPLGIGGEFLHPVGPLATPPEGVAAAGYPAVRLFADRAAAARPGFVVTADNAGAVAEICRRLDGLPLAIEMACTRLRSMPLAEVAARLSDRFRLLTGGNRTALPRHRTLLAVVDWSWRLLTGEERALARRLAVFTGGATLAAARAVCGDVDDLLASLVDRSFLQLLDVPGRPPRYRMLDTIGAFVAGELTDDEAARVRRAHAAYFLALAEEAEPNLRGPAQLRWFAELDREYGNVSAALRWAVDAGDAATALRLIAALGWYWTLRDSHDEAAGWLRRALALPAGTIPPAVHAFDAMYHAEKDPERGRAAAEAARRCAGPDPRTWHPAVAFMTLVLGGPAGAAATAELASHPDDWVAAQAELMAGHTAGARGELPASAAHYAAALTRFESSGDRWGIASAASSVAGVHSVYGRHEKAIEAVDRALSLTESLGATTDALWLRAQRGRYRLRAGDIEGARADLTRAGEDSRASAVVAMARIGLAALARRTGRPATLAGLLSELAGNPGWPETYLLVHALIEAGRGAAAAGDPAAADERLTRALRLAGVNLAAGSLTAEAAEAMAQVAMARDDAHAAARLLGLAAAVRGGVDMGDPDVRDTESAARAALGPAFDEEFTTASTVDSAAARAELLPPAVGEHREGREHHDDGHCPQ